MAPEQARGRATDRRADIWAFGVVLYEMLTGRRAFEGDDVSITLASVLKDDLKWTELPPDLPPSIRRLLRRSLEKEPRRRLSAIGDARLELEDLSEMPAVAPAAPTPAGWRQAMPWALALLASAALLGTLALWAPWRRPPVNPPVRVVADIGVESPLAVNMGSGGADLSRRAGRSLCRQDRGPQHALHPETRSAAVDVVAGHRRCAIPLLFT